MRWRNFGRPGESGTNPRRSKRRSPHAVLIRREGGTNGASPPLRDRRRNAGALLTDVVLAEVDLAVCFGATFGLVVVGLAVVGLAFFADVVLADVFLAGLAFADVFLADAVLAGVVLADVFLAGFGPDLVEDVLASAERFPVVARRARLAASCVVEGVRPFGCEVLLGIGYSVGGCDAGVVGAGLDGSVDGVVDGGGMVVVTGRSGRGTEGRSGCSFCQHD